VSFLDSITPGVGSLVGGALNFLGGTQTNEATADRADQANVWSAAQYGKRYQTMVKDITKAGLNPMLAYSQSPGSAPSAQQVQFQNPMASASQAYSSIRSSEAQASQAETTAFSARKQAEQIDATVANIKEEFKNIPLRGNEINALVAKLNEEKTLLMRKGLNEIDIGNNLRQIFSKLKSETSLLNNQLEVEKSLNNIGRYSKELGPIAQLLLNIFRSSK